MGNTHLLIRPCPWRRRRRIGLNLFPGMDILTQAGSHCCLPPGLLLPALTLSMPASHVNPPFSSAGAHAAQAAELERGRVGIVGIEGALAAVTGAAGGRVLEAVIRPGESVWAGGPFWLAPTVADLEAALPASAAPVHRRLIRRLSPGPAIFVASEGLGVAGAAPELRAAMVSAAPMASELAAAARGPLAAVELLEPGGHPLLEYAPVGAAGEGGARAFLRSAGIDNLLDLAEPRPVGRLPATVIELGSPADPSGERLRILRTGAYEERFIRKQLAVNILFVCTGNTCRSPMAEAIATDLAKEAKGLELHFASAGTGAGSGAPATAEAVEAVRALGHGSGLRSHRSRPLTRRLIDEADAIYTMGRSHLAAVLELAPDAADKARVLDPDGGDVPDPIGMSRDVYESTARRLAEMIRRRLKELGT